VVETQHTEANLDGRKNHFGLRALGGWGKRKGLPPSVSATADALRVLDLCQQIGTARSALLPTAQRKEALEFLRRELGRWLAEAASGEEGDVSSDVTIPNVAAALRGLLGRGISLSGTDAVVSQAVHWLLDGRATNSGGWGMYAGSGPELLPTYHAIWALETVHEKGIEDAKRLDEIPAAVRAGRDHLRDLAIEPIGVEGEEAQLGWKQTEECIEISPGATAVVVLSLSESDDPADAAAASAGARWLVANPSRWCLPDDRAYEVILPGEAGRFPNFVLCALACVRSPIFPDAQGAHSAIGAALVNVEDMWDPNRGGFAPQSRMPYVGTTRTILSVDEAISRKQASWVALARSSRRHPLGIGQKVTLPWHVSLVESELTVIDEERGVHFRYDVSLREEEVLRQIHNSGGRTSIEVLAQELGSKPEPVEAVINRFNQKVIAGLGLKSPQDGAGFKMIRMEHRRPGAKIKRIWFQCDVRLASDS
jgi:hypothetical protein